MLFRMAVRDSLRRAALTLTGAMLFTAGCASLPDPGMIPAQASQPQVKTANGNMTTYARSKKILESVGAKLQGDNFFARHLAVEEAIVGHPLVAGNSVKLLENGPEAYEAMFKSIGEAKDHINLEMYILESDGVGEKLAAILKKKRAEGVAVNLIVDGVGSLDTPKEYFEDLRKAGINVVIFNPVNPLEAKKGWSINDRDHRKILIVDGKTGFTGGINLSNVYSSSPSGSGSSGRSGSGRPSSARPSGGAKKNAEAPWRDTHVQIEGPAVEDLQRLFFDTWADQKGPAPAPANYFPKQEPRGPHVVRIVGSGGEGKEGAIYLTYLSAIGSAQKSIHITMAYFVPDDATMDALKRAAQRGVDVQLVLPGFSDFWAVFHAGRSHYDELLESGVKICERRDALLHAKTAVIDGVWSTVGSSNLDWRSFLHNLEANAVVVGVDFGKQMEVMFKHDLASCEPVTLESWRKRPISTRFKEWAARLWQYWL